MFERYTERARRIIFFARYEASQFGSPNIESEHLLLGLLREDRSFALRILKTQAALDSIRHQIEAHAPKRPAIGTSVDLPFTTESKRILAYASEEAERLNHRYIDSPHLMLGIIRQSQSLAANILLERQVNIQTVRAAAAEKQSVHVTTVTPVMPPQTLLEALQLPGITVTVNLILHDIPVNVAVFAGSSPQAPPSLAILLLAGESLAQLRASLQILHDAGVPNIWIIDTAGPYIYTSTPAEGLHETSAETLSIPNSPITIERRHML